MGLVGVPAQWLIILDPGKWVSLWLAHIFPTK